MRQPQRRLKNSRELAGYLPIILCLIVLSASGCSKTSRDKVSSSPVASTAAPKAAADSPNQHGAIPRTGEIDFSNMNLYTFIPLYSEIAQAEVDKTQLGKLPPVSITLKTTNNVTRAEAVQLLEKALFDQAGIVVVHEDEKHVVLKYRSSTGSK